VDRLVGERELPSGERLRVALESYRGRVYLHARRYYRDGDEWKPGKGLGLDPALLPWLRKAIADAEAVALAEGLVDEESYEAAGLPLPPQLGGADA